MSITVIRLHVACKLQPLISLMKAPLIAGVEGCLHFTVDLEEVQ